jgi:hypothetical protein
VRAQADEGLWMSLISAGQDSGAGPLIDCLLHKAPTAESPGIFGEKAELVWECSCKWIRTTEKVITRDSRTITTPPSASSCMFPSQWQIGCCSTALKLPLAHPSGQQPIHHRRWHWQSPVAASWGDLPARQINTLDIINNSNHKRRDRWQWP